MFHPWTPIDMANGSTVPIAKIRVGDETKGGLVIAAIRSAAVEFYWYAGVLVTGDHMVKEEIWICIKDSKGARHFPFLTEVVCGLVTEKRRIWASGIEFADEYENDNLKLKKDYL